jgi:hypothetical protein
MSALIYAKLLAVCLSYIPGSKYISTPIRPPICLQLGISCHQGREINLCLSMLAQIANLAIIFPPYLATKLRQLLSQVHNLLSQSASFLPPNFIRGRGGKVEPVPLLLQSILFLRARDADMCSSASLSHGQYPKNLLYSKL